MSDNPNHYEVLGVQHDATLEKIIHAYNAYKGNGIDENPQDSPQISKEKLQHAMKVAYDILKDSEKREEYDRTLASAPTVHNNQAVLGLGQTSLSLEENIPIEKEEQSEKDKAESMGEIVVEGPSSPISDVDDKVQALGVPHDVPPKTEMQWVDAIKNSDRLKLKELLRKDKSCLWKYEKEGRTALTIAVEVDDYLLVFRILEELLKAQQEKKTYFFFHLLNPASDFDSLIDYIEKSNLLNVSAGILKLIEGERRVSLGDWYSRAIEQRDSATLLNMLNSSEFLRIFVDYARGQRTLLHVAAMHGRFSLVKELLEKLTSKVGTPNFGKDEVLYFIMAVDPETQMTALQMADDIIGNRSISELIKLTLQFLKSSENTFSVFVAHQSEGLFEAYPHTQWYRELKMYVEQGHQEFGSVNSAMLRHSLQQNSRLLLEAFHGLSALHLAILFGDKNLTDTIMALFAHKRKIVWGDSYYPEALSWEQMCEAKRLDGVEFDMVNFQYSELNLLPYYNISAQKIAVISSNQNLISFDSGEEIIITSLPEHSPTFSAMNDYIDQNVECKSRRVAEGI